MYSGNDWWDLVLDIAFVGRLDADKIRARLEEAQDRLSEVQPPSRVIDDAQPYLEKAMELSQLLAAELLLLTRSRKAGVRNHKQ